MHMSDYLNDQLSHSPAKVAIVPGGVRIRRLVDASLIPVAITVCEEASSSSAYSDTTVTTVKELITNL